MKIKYIPSVLDKKDRREFDVEYKFQSVEDYFKLSRQLDDVEKENTIPVISGKKVEWDAIPAATDEIVFINDITGGNNFWGAILGALMIVVGAVLVITGYGAAFGYPLIVGGVSMIAGSAIGMLMSPSLANRSSEPFKESRTYAWEGVQNTIGEGSTVPVVYGRHIIGGVPIEAFVSGETQSGIQNETYLYALIAVGEGEIEGIEADSVCINKHELKYFESTVEIDTRTGTRDQTHIPNFSKIVKRYSISGAHLKYNSTYNYKTNSPADAVKIGIYFPALFHASGSSILNNSAKFRIEYAELINGVESFIFSAGEYTATAASKSSVNFSVLVNLPKRAQYIIKIKRLTAEFDKLEYAGDSYLASVEEIEEAALTYPNTALLGLKIKATDKISGSMPNMTCIVKGRKLKDVRDLNAAPAYSNNPANIVYDILTNKRYGLGRYITDDNINIDSLIEFADWCDEEITYNQWNGFLGAYEEIIEKRYEFNIVLDAPFKASDILSKVCGSCRGIPYWEGDKFKVVIDRATTPIQLFTMGNIVEGSYEETYFGKPDMPNQVEAQIMDESDEFKKVYVTGVDKSRLNEAIVSKAINLFGFTKKSYARRELSFAMRRAKAIRKQISFDTGLDGKICQVGDQILFQHQQPQYGWGGRVSALSPDKYTIKLDQKVPTILGETYRLRIRKLDGEFVVYDFIGRATGEYDEFTLGRPADPLREIEEVIIDAEVGDVYAVGLIGIEAKPLRIISISKKEDNIVSMITEEYNESVYEDDETIEFVEKNYSHLGLTETYELDGTVQNPQPVRIAGMSATSSDPNEMPPYILDVVLSEKVNFVGGNLTSSIVVQYGKAEMPTNALSKVIRYNIIASKDGGETWYDAGNTKGTSHEIRNVEVGATYHILVKPITTYGVTNNIEDSEHKLKFPITISGVATIPSAVTGFMGAQVGEQIRFLWNNVNFAVGYEIRMNSWDFGISVGYSASNSFLTYISKTGLVDFYIKPFNVNGVYAGQATHCQVDVRRVANLNVLFEQDNKELEWAGAKVNFTPAIGLQMTDGAAEATYYPNMVVFEGNTRTKNTIQYAIAAFDGSDDFWDDKDVDWDDCDEFWAIAIDTGHLKVEHDISLFEELSEDFIDVIRCAGSVTSVNGNDALVEKDVLYDLATFHRGVIKALGTEVTHELDLPDDFSIFFRFSLGEHLTAGIIARLINDDGELQVIMFPAGIFWLFDGATFLETRVNISQYDHLRFGVAKNESGFRFYTGNVTKNISDYTEGSLTFTKPDKITI